MSDQENPTRIAVYSRQSEPNDDQVREHIRLCVTRVEREGDTVVGPFYDDGISGFKRKVRPGYEELLAAVRGGQVDAVMAVTYDRLLRKDTEGVRLAETLEAAGVLDVLFTDEGDIDLRTADGRKLFRDRASAAEHYSDRLGEKVRGSKRRIAHAGRWCGAAPHGYDTVPGPAGSRNGSSLVENVVQADVIREAVAAIKAGQNPHQIAVAFRARGRTTGWGHPWNSKALRRVLLSPAIAGLASLNGEVLYDDGEPLPVSWAPIISREDYELLKVRLAPGTADRHPDAVNLKHPLAGILRCGKCSTPMYGATLKSIGKSRYTCSTERGGCGGVSISAQIIEPMLVQFVNAALLVELRVPIGDGVALEVHEAAAAELSAIASDRAKLNALAASDMFTAAELAPKFAALKKRDTAAKASLARPAAVEFDPQKTAETLKARWDAYKRGDRDAAELLHSELAIVIERIDVAPIPKGARRNVFDPGRLNIVVKLPEPLGSDDAQAHVETLMRRYLPERALPSEALTAP